MSESLSVEEFDLRDKIDWATPIEDLVLVSLDDDLPDQVVYIGSFLNAGPLMN